MNADRLRPLLETRSRDGFLRICRIFADWPPGPQRSRTLDEVRRALTAWSDEARALHPLGDLDDFAVLARTLEIYRREERGSDDLVAVARSPYLTGLTTLRIVGSDISDAAWQAMAASPHLGGLRTLAVRGGSLGDRALDELLRAGRFRLLAVLEMAGVGLEAGGLATSARGVPFPALARLDLYGNILGDAGARALAAAPWMTPVRSLVLARNHLTGRGVEALLTLNGLAELDVRDNELSAAERSTVAAAARRRGVDLVL